MRENPTCSHAWHAIAVKDRVLYCPACGQRRDGKRTLANMTMAEIMACGGVVTLLHEESQERVSGHLNWQDHGFEIEQRQIPLNEANCWLLEGVG